MTINSSKRKQMFSAVGKFINAVCDPRTLKTIPSYIGYFKDLARYKKMNNAENIEFVNMYPRLRDKTETSNPTDWHYFYQGQWAFKLIKNSGAAQHVDVGSAIDFIGYLTTIIKVVFIDIRPFVIKMDNIESKPGTILKMPFDDSSIKSLSSLHVVEHIGLGRYGDPLDPEGSIKAAKELSRVLSKGGHLYFSMPIGKPRVCFNAHRIHTPKQIVSMFPLLQLVEYSAVSDNGEYYENIGLEKFSDSEYSCGMFHFTKQ